MKSEKRKDKQCNYLLITNNYFLSAVFICRKATDENKKSVQSTDFLARQEGFEPYSSKSLSVFKDICFLNFSIADGKVC